MRLAAWGCSFPERRLERAWQQKFCSDQAALDSAISLQTLLFPSMVARVLWERVHCGGVASLAAWEVLWLAVFLAWAPLFLFLAQRRPQAWQRWRTPLVLASRVHRQLTVLRWAAISALDTAQGGGAKPAWPSSLESQLGMLLWRPGSMITLLGTYLLPFKYNAPCAALLLAVMLHGTARQCAAECAGGATHAHAAGLYAGLVHKAQQLRLLPWRGSDAGAAVCGSPGAPPGAPGVCAAAGCLRSCVAVHAWAQVVLGALLPLCVLWAVEEWSRLRFQRQWLECYELAPATPSAAAGEQPGGSSRQATAQPPVAQPAPPPPPSPELRPAPWYALLLGLLACAWAVLATLDLAVLPPS